MQTKTFRYNELAEALIATGALSDMATDYDGWKRLALMLADLGEDARSIFDKISATASNYDAKQTNSIFSWALNNYDPTKITIGSFLHLCSESGIDISEYVTIDSNELRPVSRGLATGTKGRWHYKKEPYKPKPLPSESTMYSMPASWITASMPESYESSPLARYLAHKFGWEKVNAAFRLYYVGVTRKPVHLEGMHFLPVGSCIFPQVDEKGIIRTAQIMAYDDEKGYFGHRTKYAGSRQSALTWMHTLMMMKLLKSTNGKWGWDDNRKRKPYNCITGAHLLNGKVYPTLADKTVGIVESMSTALCMTCAMPDIVWLATAGSAGIRLLADGIFRDCPSLKSRRIIIYPDEGKTDQWRKAIAELRLEHVSVSDFMDRQPIHGGDIKDIVMSAPCKMEDLPEPPRKIIETPKIMLDNFKESNPLISTLVDLFELTPISDECPF